MFFLPKFYFLYQKVGLKHRYGIVRIFDTDLLIHPFKKGSLFTNSGSLITAEFISITLPETGINKSLEVLTASTEPSISSALNDWPIRGNST
jgi:hypothetical protein